jgi:hypothetical protein
VGSGLIPTLAELGEQSYQLTSAWVPVGTTSLECSVLEFGRCIVRCVACYYKYHAKRCITALLGVMVQ